MQDKIPVNIPSVLDTDVRNGIAQDEMIDAVYAGTAGDLLKAAFAGRHDRADTNIAKMNYREAEPSRYPPKAAPLVWGS